MIRAMARIRYPDSVPPIGRHRVWARGRELRLMALIWFGIGAGVAAAGWALGDVKTYAAVALALPMMLGLLSAAFGFAAAWSQHCPRCGRELSPTPSDYFARRDRIVRRNRIWCEPCGHIEVDRVRQC